MTMWLTIAGRSTRVEVPDGALSGGPMAFAVDGKRIECDARLLQAGVLSLLIDGAQYRCLQDGTAIVVSGHPVQCSTADPRSLAARTPVSAGGGGVRTVKAPMPGRVVRLLVAPGEPVEAQQGLLVIEAMKMQNELRAPKAGRITRVAVAVGETVATGDVLVVVE